MYTPVAKELAQVEERLSRISKEGVGELAGMLDYVAGTGGKRVRPAITLLAARFHATDYTLPIIMATAVELLHVATLIHDDTVDNSSLRRGKATVGSLWGRNAAVLLGDYVFATSATFVCDTGNVVPSGASPRLSWSFPAASCWSTSTPTTGNRKKKTTATGYTVRRRPLLDRRRDRRSPQRCTRTRSASPERLRPPYRHGLPDRRRHPRRAGVDR